MVLMINLSKIISDCQIPFLEDAILFDKVEPLLRQYIPQVIDGFNLSAIQVIRHKPEKRCLIEYKFVGKNAFSLIGKIRAKGTDLKSFYVQKELWNQKFNDKSTDKISVPEPVGVIPELQMWLQRKVSGTMATSLLATSQGVYLASKIAQAVHKLHQTNILIDRYHTINDELKILHQRLPQVIQQYPYWQTRLEKVLEKCDQLGTETPQFQPCGIHRDFYADQIMVNGSRLFIVDFDLYCQGDPCLDIGNFIGHIIEYSLRLFGYPDGLKAQEIALIETFMQLAGEEARKVITTYTTLTLVRHIYLSTQFLERRIYTEALLELCEERLFGNFNEV